MKKINHYHVLIADDEMYSRHALRQFFEKENNEFLVTEEASDGQQALDILKGHDMQVLFTDIRMPVMDGLELARRAGSLYPDLLIVILSGYADFEYAQTAVRYGAFDYLLKPVNEEDMDNTLDRLRSRLRQLYELTDEDNISRTGARESVDLAIRYMNQHYMEDIDIGLLADRLGFQSAYLTRIFNRYAGDSPLKYLTSIRIREAKRLLTETSLSISSIGEAVGYPDQFHFSKTFRKATGMNPSSWRKENSAESNTPPTGDGV